MPKPLLACVVVHELCRLRHRNHSQAYRQTVRGQLLADDRRSAWRRAMG